MNQDMSHNYLEIYERSLVDLAKSPDSPEFKHRAVLALARAGALDFARAEYARYGLDKVKDDEDIMALGGRLLKDAALRRSDEFRQNLALESALKYEMANVRTGGYYSAINAASMRLLSGASDEDIINRANNILENLPSTEALDKEEIYFVKATQAEAELLQENYSNAARYLRSAVAHDPLNYTAHASTLRQFEMILAARGQNTSWLSAFIPPKSIHFAGHMFGNNAENGDRVLSPASIETLRIEVSDTIQRSDIGFGYGALAAGADILIAETLLEEGSELHVVLPIEPEKFKAISVSPYGAQWEARFDNCLAYANTIYIAESDKKWPQGGTAEYANQIAMGLASMRALQLSTQAAQLLIWDGKAPAHNIGTGRDAALWARTEREQIVIPYPVKRPASSCVHVEEVADKLIAVICSASETHHFDRIDQAAEWALSELTKSGTDLCLGGHYGPMTESAINTEVATSALEKAFPGTVYISEAFAAVLAAFHQADFETNFVGLSKGGIRLFSLNKLGKA